MGLESAWQFRRIGARRVGSVSVWRRSAYSHKQTSPWQDQHLQMFVVCSILTPVSDLRLRIGRRRTRGLLMKQSEPTFSAAQIEAIARALGDTEDGLTGSEIGHILATCRLDDVASQSTKWVRIHNALVTKQNKAQNRRAILEFIRQAMQPSRHLRHPKHFEAMREHLNRALAFDGLAVREDGRLVSAKRASTLTEAGQRARELRASLESRGVHPDVLRFCRAEILADNYFHAVLEATKSIAEKIRDKTGLSDDGAELIDRALSGSPPLLAINPLLTKSEQAEQKGFANLLKGLFGMFRNPTAHAPRISWQMEKSDAEDLLSILSLVHRRLDTSHMPSRA